MRGMGSLRERGEMKDQTIPLIPFTPLIPCPQTRSPAEAALLQALSLTSGGRDHVDGAALLRALDGELDGAVDQREQRVVAAQADARTRMELGAALADDDVAGLDGLAAVHLHAEVLRVGVAAVARGTYALLVCHDCVSCLLLVAG